MITVFNPVNSEKHNVNPSDILARTDNIIVTKEYAFFGSLLSSSVFLLQFTEATDKITKFW